MKRLYIHAVILLFVAAFFNVSHANLLMISKEKKLQISEDSGEHWVPYDLGIPTDHIEFFDAYYAKKIDELFILGYDLQHRGLVVLNSKDGKIFTQERVEYPWSPSEIDDGDHDMKIRPTYISLRRKRAIVHGIEEYEYCYINRKTGKASWKLYTGIGMMDDLVAGVCAPVTENTYLNPVQEELLFFSTDGKCIFAESTKHSVLMSNSAYCSFGTVFFTGASHDYRQLFFVLPKNKQGFGEKAALAYGKNLSSLTVSQMIDQSLGSDIDPKQGLEALVDGGFYRFVEEQEQLLFFLSYHYDESQISFVLKSGDGGRSWQNGHKSFLLPKTIREIISVPSRYSAAEQEALQFHIE